MHDGNNVTWIYVLLNDDVSLVSRNREWAVKARDNVHGMR